MIDIKTKKDCVGCGACAQRCPEQCISMCEDEEGFLYPKVTMQKCIHCGLCEQTCPVINQNEGKKPLMVYAVKNNDDRIRKESSSGGVFTLLAEKVIEKGGIVFGAKWNGKWEVEHGYVETVNELALFRKSKYVQSRIGSAYIDAERFLKDGRQVLFSGTPCQIAGLKRYLKKDYSNLVTVDFVCHGVPSPLVWKKYLLSKMRPLGTVGKNTVSSSLKVPSIEGISFRDKRNGWKRSGFAVMGKSVLDTDKNTVSPSVNSLTLIYEPLGENAFLHGFVRNLFLRPSCYQCAFKSFKSNSDYTLADFWGVEKYAKDFDDDRGVSLLFVHQNNYDIRDYPASFRPIDMDMAVNQNPSVNKSAKKKDYRRCFFKKIQRGKVTDIEKHIRRYAKYSIREYSRTAAINILIKTKLLNVIKRLLGK